MIVTLSEKERIYLLIKGMIKKNHIKRHVTFSMQLLMCEISKSILTLDFKIQCKNSSAFY